MKNTAPALALASLALATGLSFADNKGNPEGEFWTYPNRSPASEATEVRLPHDIDLAICLDTSGSMEGLIESAKQRLFALVNDLAKAEPAPRLRISILTFGSPSNGADNGWVKTVVPLTTDLDLVYMKLFELRTDGGEEYVARVADIAAKQLAWSTEPGALKMIVVAGNESAEQDPLLTLEQSIGGAAERGILVHALYCRQGGSGAPRMSPITASNQNLVPTGIQSQVLSSLGSTGPIAASSPAMIAPLDEIALGWKKIATLAHGAFAMIDQDDGIVVMDTPFDEEMILLSSELNGTYIPYGEGSEWNCSNQIAQDANSIGLNNEAAASRAMTKAGKLYLCSWDLVDALDSGQVEMGTIDMALLSEDLRSLDAVALEALVQEKRASRKRIQGEMDALGVQRETFLMEKRAELGDNEAEAFDSVLRNAFRGKAAAKGFRFPVSEAPAPSVPPLEGC